MIIAINDVIKKFEATTALEGISFNVQKGNTVGLLGPNGSGKTTTMRLLTGMIDPDGGSIRVMDMDPQKQGDNIRAVSGVLTENAAMYEWMTGGQNLEFFGALYGVGPAVLAKKIEEMVQLFGMGDYVGKKVSGYSTGMKKRLAVARALINEPQILLLDEPTSGLDPESAQSILKLIQLLKDKEVTILLCTHNLNEAQKVCDEFVFLDSGRILEAGSLDYLKKKYNHVETLILRVGGNIPSKYNTQNGEILIDIPSEKKIPEIIRTISRECDVYDAHLKEHDLSDIYFKVRGKVQ
jgi:ABC-2 type transport system ATP-binding protein